MKKKISDFYQTIAGFNELEDGFIEVTIDFKEAHYFNKNQIEQLINFTGQKAKEGHEVHFGPAVRTKNLGSKRSTKENVLRANCFWVDIDPPDKTLSPEKKQEESKKLLDEFRHKLLSYKIESSYIIKSGYGYHVYFVIRKNHCPPGEQWALIQKALIAMAKGDSQAKDSVRLLRSPGTFNYKKKGNPQPVSIYYQSNKKSCEEDFQKIVKDYAPKVKSINITNSEAKPLGFTPPCIEHLLNPNNKPSLGYRHQVRIIIGTYAFREGWSIEDTFKKIMHTTDDPKKAKADIKGIYNTLEHDPTRYSIGCKEGSSLRALVDAGITVCDEDKCGFKKKKLKKEEEKIIYSASFPGLVDIVRDDNGKLSFLIKENNILIMKDKHIIDDKTFIPPPEEAIIWLAPLGTSVINHYNSMNNQEDFHSLFKEIIPYLNSISELPTEDHYSFMSAYIMHTHLVDLCEYSPIIWFYAVPERGKTRTLKGLQSICRRCVIFPVFHEAHIIRMASNQKATLCIDIMDLQKKLEKTGSEDILLNSFERGSTVPRVLHLEKGPFCDTVYYDIYGPTIIATNKFLNPILETRSVQIIMPETTRIFENDVKSEAGLPLKEKLTAFRAKMMDQKLPSVKKVVGGRLGDILKPIHQIVKMGCSDDTWFLNFAIKIEQSRKISNIDTLEARVLSALLEVQIHMENGHILHSYTLEILNQDTPERYCISPQKLGRVTKTLGFKKYFSGKARGIYWNEDLINSLCKRYGIQNNQLLTV